MTLSSIETPPLIIYKFAGDDRLTGAPHIEYVGRVAGAEVVSCKGFYAMWVSPLSKRQFCPIAWQNGERH